MVCHVRVIHAFGGITALAKAIDLDPKLATHWGRRGIPARYWPLIAETEKARKLGITAGALMRGAKPMNGCGA